MRQTHPARSVGPSVLIVGLVLGTLTTSTMPFSERRKKDSSIYLLYNVERRAERPEHHADDTPAAPPEVERTEVAKVI
jgi:hypothetical protein